MIHLPFETYALPFKLQSLKSLLLRLFALRDASA